MMVEFKWIQIYLFLVALLQFTAAEQHPPSFTVRDGGEVTLPCGNVTDGQQNCDGTSWVFSVSSNVYARKLIELGQIVELARGKSDRLSVTENCSLVIKEVTVEDVGRYSCRQFNKSGHQQDPGSEVLLSVVTMTLRKKDDVMALDCSVSTFGRCRHKVEWLHVPVDLSVRTSQSSCSASAQFMSLHYLYNLFRCKVTGGNEVQEFDYRPWPSPGEELTTKPTTTTDDSSRELKAPAGCSAVNYIMLVLRVAELLLITVITVLLIRAPGNHRPPDDNTLSDSVKRPPLRRSGAAASQVNDDEDEDGGVVNYENFGDSSA